MSGIQPVAVYALKVPPGGALIPAVPDAAAMVSINWLDSFGPVRQLIDFLVSCEHGCG